MKWANRFFTVAFLVAGVAGSGARGQTLTTLHSFSGPDGAIPEVLIDAGSGTFYGAAIHGGAHGAGRIFSITSGGVFTELYDFTGGNDGHTPASLALGDNGNLFGCADGGALVGGTIWELTLGPGSALTIISSLATDTLGNALSPGIIKGNDGNFYGNWTRTDGPIYDTIFRLSESGTLTPLINLNGFNGDNIAAGVQAPGGGDVFGVTRAGGTSFGGTSDTGFGTFGRYLINSGTVTVLHSFNGTTDGSVPHALIQGNDGNFYGLTSSSEGQGETDTFFKVTSSGNLTTILTFDHSVGRLPIGLIQASDNNFYGTMLLGGPGYDGVKGGNGFIYKISGSAFSLVYTFAGTNGSAPAILRQGSDGKLYGTTALGGLGNSGTVFRLDGVIAASGNPSITTASLLPTGTVGVAYNTTLDANGGTVPYTWSIPSGLLPSGLTLVASTGAITGTPTVASTENFTAKVTDINNHSASQAFSLSVTSVVAVTRIIGLNGSLAFGSVTTGAMPTASLTITNFGNSSLTVTNLTYPNGFSGAFSGVIPAGSSHDVQVTFAPVTPGDYSGLVTAISDATSGTTTIHASGTGITNATSELTFSKVGLKLNFAKPDVDSASVTVTMDLGADFSPSNQTAVAMIGGVQLSFLLSDKGAGVNGVSTFKLKAPKAPSTIWTGTVAFKHGSFAADWAGFGLVNATIKKPGVQLVVPVEVDLNGQVFTGHSPSLTYTATAGKSGSAK